MRRIAALLLGLGAVLASVAATTAPAGAADPQFTLTVDYRGLYPNADLDVPVTVQNPQSFPILVQTATTTVGDAGPGCASSNVEVQTFAGDVRVPAGGTATVPIHFHMLATAPDACQGATFPLTFRAAGVPAPDTSTTTTTATATATAGGGSFAFTGSGTGTLVLAGAGALLVITGGLLASRRHREVPR